jgi:predicted metal-binding membrane protein
MGSSAEVQPRLPRRDRWLLSAGLLLITAVAWADLLHMAATMQAPMALEPLGVQAWSVGDAAAMVAMWIVMMIAMMVPSAAPMVLLYGAVARKARDQGTVLAPSGIFLSGYLLVWSAFSLFATLLQWGLDQAALLSPMLVLSSPWIGATLLIAAGVYQFTPAKNACLAHCRSPVHFLSGHWQPGWCGAVRMGLEHGLYCLGCCWILMALLFVGGVMNLAWIAALSLFVLAEKLLPFGVWAGRLAGGGAMVAGLLMLPLRPS